MTDNRFRKYILFLRSVFHRTEDGILVSIFLGMIILAVVQITARNFWDYSWSWIDPLNRTAVLWIALLGAMIGTRRNEHIKIDAITPFLPPFIRNIIERIIAAISSAALILLAWHTGRLVIEERSFGSTGFAELPVWPFQTIMPIAFAIMSLRYALMIFIPVEKEQE